MPRVRYAGYETLTYMNYLDALTGRTLTCEPGGVYEPLPEVPPGPFVLLDEDVPGGISPLRDGEDDGAVQAAQTGEDPGGTTGG